MSNFKNRAAFVSDAKSKILQVDSTDLPQLQSDCILVRNSAVAINPVDHILQTLGTSPALRWLRYPLVLGSDISGTVVSVGTEVSHIKCGDRVLGHAVGHDKNYNATQNAEAGFQSYTMLRAYMTTKIPPNLRFEQACVLPLGCSTAACGLFQKDLLALQTPMSPPRADTGLTVIVWGGATSVGCNAIQLARASGYRVVTTCSPKNFDMVKSIGAAAAFDYKSTTVGADIISYFKRHDLVCAGALTAGSNGADCCFDILREVECVHPEQGLGKGKFVAMAAFPIQVLPPKPLIVMAYSYISWQIGALIKSWTRGIGFKFIFGVSLAYTDDVGRTVYNDFLPKALAAGEYKCMPLPHIVGSGLESLQNGLDYLRQGVSAQKVVVMLE